MQIIEITEEEIEKNVAIAEVDNAIEATGPSLDDLDSEAGFFQLFVRPMLKPGHEGELCEWLKEMGLLKRSMKCINTVENAVCNTLMQWSPARILDKYQWVCHKCNSKRSIRENTAFKQMKCSLATALRIILGWCKNIEMEEISEILHTKLYIVKKIYEMCTSIVITFFQLYKNEFSCGGFNTLVIIDSFPLPGYDEEINSNLQNNNNIQPILCIAEVKEIPTHFYFHPYNTINEAVIKIKEIVQPETAIVINTKLGEDVFNYLRECNKYSVIIGTEELTKFDTTISKTLHANLSVIWLPAKNICNEAQKYGNVMNNYLIEQMWVSKFGSTPSTAFEYLMHNFNDCWENQLID